MDALLLTKRLDAPDEVRHFEKGSLSLVQVGPMVIAGARYEPGWIWSKHVGTAEARECGRVTYSPSVPDTMPGATNTSRTAHCSSWAQRSTRLADRCSRRARR